MNREHKSASGRRQQSTPVFLPGKSHKQRSLAGYGPWGCKTVRHDLATEQHKSSLGHPLIRVYLLTLTNLIKVNLMKKSFPPAPPSPSPLPQAPAPCQMLTESTVLHGQWAGQPVSGSGPCHL